MTDVGDDICLVSSGCGKVIAGRMQVCPEEEEDVIVLRRLLCSLVGDLRCRAAGSSEGKSPMASMKISGCGVGCDNLDKRLA